MLDAHLDEFKENLGAYSEEHGELFHEDIKDFESRYQEQYNESMLEDYIWGLIRESDLEYRRKSRKTTHFQLNCVQYFTQEPCLCYVDILMQNIIFNIRFKFGITLGLGLE